jgi:molybdopterin synthase sulfur carrier subunit
MMTATIKLFATLRDKRFETRKLDLPASCNVRDLLNKLGIAESEIALIIIDGRHSDFLHEIKDGETIALFPPIGGG